MPRAQVAFGLWQGPQSGSTPWSSGPRFPLRTRSLPSGCSPALIPEAAGPASRDRRNPASPFPGRSHSPRAGSSYSRDDPSPHHRVWQLETSSGQFCTGGETEACRGSAEAPGTASCWRRPLSYTARLGSRTLGLYARGFRCSSSASSQRVSVGKFLNLPFITCKWG